MPADQKAVVFQGSEAQGLKGPAELLGCTAATRNPKAQSKGQTALK